MHGAEDCNAAHLDVADGQSCMKDSKGKEGAKVLGHENGIKAHHRDACCRQRASSALTLLNSQTECAPRYCQTFKQRCHAPAAKCLKGAEDAR